MRVKEKSVLIKGTRLGDIEVTEGKIITFPYGLLGFEKMKRYVLLTPNPSSPFRWFQSVDNPELAFVVVNPLVFHPTYDMKIPAAQLDVIACKDAKNLAVLVIVTIPEDPAKMTANLAGPLLINTKNMTGVQAVLGDEEYSTEHPILKEFEALGNKPFQAVNDNLNQIVTIF